MDKILKALASFLKEGADVEAIKTAIEPLLKELNPIEGLNPENVGAFLSQTPVLKAAFDKKVEATSKKRFEDEFEKAYQARYVKDHPDEDPTRKEVRQLKADLEKEKLEGRRRDLLGKAQAKAKELKLPDEAASLYEHLIGDDEDATYANLSKLSFIPTVISKGIEAGVAAKIKTPTPRASHSSSKEYKTPQEALAAALAETT